MKIDEFYTVNYDTGNFDARQHHVWVDREEVGRLFKLESIRGQVIVNGMVRTLEIKPDSLSEGVGQEVTFDDNWTYSLNVGLRGLKDEDGLGALLRDVGRCRIGGSKDVVTIMPDYWNSLPASTEESKN